MILHIKHMVCDRCKLVVRQQLEALKYEVLKLTLGEADIRPSPDKKGLEKIRHVFSEVGFELLEDKKEALVERIKGGVIEYMNSIEKLSHLKMSTYLSSTLVHDYVYLSHIFSEIEGSTIEKYVIITKIEKVKELIRYDELTISEIAWKLGYSSVQALSSQFRKIEAQTPSHYKLSLQAQKVSQS